MPKATQVNWAARVFTDWGTALAEGSDQTVSFLKRSRRLHRSSIAAQALHQGLVFALTHPWIAQELVDAASFLSPEYREELRKSLWDVAKNATFERVADQVRK